MTRTTAEIESAEAIEALTQVDPTKMEDCERDYNPIHGRPRELAHQHCGD